MKKWFLERFLPARAKETVYFENRLLRRNNAALRQEIKVLRAYIDGIELGMKSRSVEREENEIH